MRFIAIRRDVLGACAALVVGAGLLYATGESGKASATSFLLSLSPLDSPLAPSLFARPHSPVLPSPPPTGWVTDDEFAPDVLWPSTVNLSGWHSWRDNVLYDWDNRTGRLDAAGNRYPIPPSSFRRAFSAPDAASQCRWEQLASALAAGAPVRIGVIGGSMTFGVSHSHHEPKTPRGWVAHLIEWTDKWAPARGWNLTVVNLAIQGQTARGHALNRCPKWSGFDAYIVDTGVNSATEFNKIKIQEGQSMLLACLLRKQAATPALPAPLPPAVMYQVGIGLSSGAGANIVGKCPMGNGVRMPALHGPRRTPWLACIFSWSRSDFEGQVARGLGLPVISYRDAVWPVYTDPPADMMLYWDDDLHPSQVPHQLYSDMAKFALMQLLRKRGPGVCGAATAQHNYSTDAPFERWLAPAPARLPASCASRDAAAGLPPAPSTPTPSRIIGNWKHEADQPHRPVGWVGRFGASGPAEPLSISFPVTFSAEPRLEFTILRSYENFLNATVAIDGCAGTALDSWPQPALLGSWDRHLSIPDVTAWDSYFPPLWRYREFNNGMETYKGVRDILCTPAAGIQHMVTITVSPHAGRALAPTDKFKILGVTSC